MYDYQNHIRTVHFFRSANLSRYTCIDFAAIKIPKFNVKQTTIPVVEEVPI